MRCALVGGEFGGQLANLHVTPRALVVTECDCIRFGHPWCGSRTHWHDLTEAQRLGDVPRRGHVYLRMGRGGPAASWVRYLGAGVGLPTPGELQRRAHLEDALEASCGRSAGTLDDVAPDPERGLSTGARW